MIIRCWGARGSIPVSGKEFEKYGGDTTCIEIRTTDDEIVIVDAGTGIRRLGNRLKEEKSNHYHLIFTHSHWDHLLGFPFFKPIYFENTHIDVYGCRFAQRSIKNILANTMQPPFFPVKLDDIKAERNPNARVVLVVWLVKDSGFWRVTHLGFDADVTARGLDASRRRITQEP